MEKLSMLFDDVALLWEKYASSYLTGMGRTLLLAVIATLAGCVIGFACGVVQTIPCSKNDFFLKRVLLGLVRGILRAYIEIFRGTPMILRPAVFHQQRHAIPESLGGVHSGGFHQYRRVYGGIRPRRHPLH